MSKQYTHIVYIGRLQPPTNAHISIINQAHQLGENVIILLGSSDQPRTIKNPWTVTERAAMIYNCIDVELHPATIIRGIRDYRYNDNKWIEQVQAIVKSITSTHDNPKIGIIGFKKDDSSYYLDLFPQWAELKTDQIEDINATDVREAYFTDKLLTWSDKPRLHPGLLAYLKQWRQTSTWYDLSAEFEFYVGYAKAWANSPYKPTFVTTDALVVQSGHILLVQRRAFPGKGLWALPGGFLDPSELIFAGCIRELFEETKIKVSKNLVIGCKRGERVFDHPGRSLRGRTITHAFHFELPAGELAKVRGSDDASRAKWFPISDIINMSEQMFEDHYEMIVTMLGLD